MSNIKCIATATVFVGRNGKTVVFLSDEFCTTLHFLQGGDELDGDVAVTNGGFCNKPHSFIPQTSKRCHQTLLPLAMDCGDAFALNATVNGCSGALKIVV